MPKAVNRQGGLTTTLNLEGVNKLIADLKYLSSGDILKRAATHIQGQAFLAMKRKYFQTKSNRIYYNKKYLSKGKDKSIESRLFDSNLPSPVRKGKYTMSFRFWPGYESLNRDLPHLRYQEKGTSTSTDSQSYAVVGIKSLGPITKRKANNRPQIKRKDVKNRDFYHFNEFGSVVKIEVRHPGLKARGFIAAGNLYLKTQGEAEFAKFIRRELRKRKNA